MVKHFIFLELKSFFRSASFGKSIALKILLGFLAVYFSLTFIGLGIILPELLESTNPKISPFITIQKFIGAWIIFELMLRFVMQTLPVINIKSFLTLNVKKTTIINYVLVKSLFSYYNFIGLFIAVPFIVVCFLKDMVTFSEGIIWIVAIKFIVFIINFLNFLIKKTFSSNFIKFLPFVIPVLTLAVLEYFAVFNTSVYISKAMLFLVANPISLLLLIGVVALIYYLNYKYLSANFYLDSFLKTKENIADSKDYSWTRRFGSIAPFLQLDLKLIWRNKRPRTTVLLSILFLAYGFIFFSNPTYKEIPAFYVFAGIFVTGIFMINFGQFIPSWDSNYFGLIHTQNIPFKNYLLSKAGLLTFSVVVLGLLALPYGYFGWNIFGIILACMLYNVGINVLVILYAGSFNKKKIDLEKSPFMNYQGTGAAQWIVGFPLLFIPILSWYGIYKLTNPEIATIALAALGVVGILLRSFFITKIVLGYQKRKYSTLQGFKQQEN